MSAPSLSSGMKSGESSPPLIPGFPFYEMRLTMSPPHRVMICTVNAWPSKYLPMAITSEKRTKMKTSLDDRCPRLLKDKQETTPASKEPDREGGPTTHAAQPSGRKALERDRLGHRTPGSGSAFY